VSSYTKTGLKVIVNVINKTYLKGINASKEDLKNCNIKHGRIIPQWNYSVSSVF